jgi:hypothetical protein
MKVSTFIVAGIVGVCVWKLSQESLPPSLWIPDAAEQQKTASTGKAAPAPSRIDQENSYPTEYFTSLTKPEQGWREDYYNIEDFHSNVTYGPNYRKHQYDWVDIIVDKFGYHFAFGEGIIQSAMRDDSGRYRTYAGRDRSDGEAEPPIIKHLRQIRGDITSAYHQCWSLTGAAHRVNVMNTTPYPFASGARGTICAEGNYIVLDAQLTVAAGGEIASSTQAKCLTPTPEQLAELNWYEGSRDSIQCTYLPEYIHFRFNPNASQTIFHSSIL